MSHEKKYSIIIQFHSCPLKFKEHFVLPRDYGKAMGFRKILIKISIFCLTQRMSDPIFIMIVS
ncbi:hypothetical protein QTP88_006028 [Uroleucon formosanum]